MVRLEVVGHFSSFRYCARVEWVVHRKSSDMVDYF